MPTGYDAWITISMWEFWRLRVAGNFGAAAHRHFTVQLLLKFDQIRVQRLSR
jgi:hypothetical protein